MTYKQTLEYLYGKLPMFTRVGTSAYRKDLDNIIQMCDRLGNPQNKIRTIHVAGTNGKGSTSHMLAAVLQQAGYKTGLYTSPHLKDFRERIRINGEMISKEFVIDFVTEHVRTNESLDPSFFEVTVAMAFSYFASEKVDVAIIEVGLGGRLDSTNIIHPDLSIITNISLDHTNILGNTIQEIAGEKAGIIKHGVPVVIGEMDNATDEIFLKKAKDMGSAIFFAENQMHIANYHQNGRHLSISVVDESNRLLFNDLQLDLTGSYQLKNSITVLSSLMKLKDQGYKISEEAIYYALKNVKALTGLQGRWQTLSYHPLTICDTAHNMAGIKEVVKNLKDTKYERLHFVIGMVKDKDITGVLKLLPADAVYYFCQPNLERALRSEELAEQAMHYGLNGTAYPTVQLAYQSAKSAAETKDLIFIGGSTFVVADVL